MFGGLLLAGGLVIWCSLFDVLFMYVFVWVVCSGFVVFVLWC